MSKVKNDSLHSLIRSLSKSEKWQFKVYAKRFNQDENKQYLDVFDLLDKTTAYSEEVILKLDTLNKRQIHNIKSNLYKQVLQALTHQHSIKSHNGSLKYLEYAQFLYNKCLYNDCLVFIEKGKKYAKDNFQATALLELLELEKMAIWQTSDEFIVERISRLIDEIANLSRQIQNINRFSNLADQLNAYYQQIGFIRNKEDLKRVMLYYKMHFPSFDSKSLSALEEMYLYATITGYYFFIQDFNKAYDNAIKLVAVFDANPSLIKSKTEFYIKALNNLLVAQNKLNLYNEFKETHRKLVLIKRNPQIFITENIALNLFKTIYLHEINRHFMLGEFKSGTRIVGALQKEIDKLIPKLNKHTVMIFYYKIACLYFGAGQFKISIKWLNRIINEKASDLRQDLQSFARILRLICYFELDDNDMIEYNVKSTYRFLLLKQNFVEYQKLIMKFLRAMKPNLSKTQLQKHFSTLRIGMLELEKNRFEKRAFLYFDIISWLESKMSNLPLQTIVKQKTHQI